MLGLTGPMCPRARMHPYVRGMAFLMSLGALPLALSIGDAATSRIPLGIVIVGGILFSLVLTLFVIPAVYVFLSSKKKKSGLDTEPVITVNMKKDNEKLS